MNSADKSLNIKKILTMSLIVGFIYLYNPTIEFIGLAISRATSSEGISDIANHSGFNYRGMVLFFKSSPELVNADQMNSKCPNSDENTIEFGCYLPNDNKIYILQVADSNYKDIEYTTAAHETLHAAWYNLSSDETTDISNKLNEFYSEPGNTSAVKLHETLKPYGGDVSVVINELHSFIGSELGSTAIGQPLNEYYARYFDNRDEAVNSKVAFQNKIDAKIASINLESDNLNSEGVAIDNYKVEWLDKIESYLPSNAYYGDTVRYNQNVNAYNSNLVIYNKKIDDHNARVAAYNKDRTGFKTFVTTFYPTTVLPDSK